MLVYMGPYTHPYAYTLLYDSLYRAHTKRPSH